MGFHAYPTMDEPFPSNEELVGSSPASCNNISPSNPCPFDDEEKLYIRVKTHHFQIKH
jgi:hypothetical protein